MDLRAHRNFWGQLIGQIHHQGSDTIEARTPSLTPHEQSLWVCCFGTKALSSRSVVERSWATSSLINATNTSENAPASSLSAPLIIATEVQIPPTQKALILMVPVLSANTTSFKNTTRLSAKCPWVTSCFLHFRCLPENLHVQRLPSNQLQICELWKSAPANPQRREEFQTGEWILFKWTNSHVAPTATNHRFIKDERNHQTGADLCFSAAPLFNSLSCQCSIEAFLICCCCHKN